MDQNGKRLWPAENVTQDLQGWHCQIVFVPGVVPPLRDNPGLQDVTPLALARISHKSVGFVLHSPLAQRIATITSTRCFCTLLRANPERKRHKSLKSKPVGRIEHNKCEISGLARGCRRLLLVFGCFVVFYGTPDLIMFPKLSLDRLGSLAET